MNYSEFIQHFQDSDLNDWIIFDEHGLFVSKRNLSVTIKREETDLSDQGRFHEEWAERFPDKNAYRQRYFLCYNQNIVEEFYAVAVDGFRSYIPYPNLKDMTITRFQYEVGRIINQIGGHNFDEYLESAGITVN